MRAVSVEPVGIEKDVVVEGDVAHSAMRPHRPTP